MITNVRITGESRSVIGLIQSGFDGWRIDGAPILLSLASRGERRQGSQIPPSLGPISPGHYCVGGLISVFGSDWQSVSSPSTAPSLSLSTPSEHDGLGSMATCTGAGEPLSLTSNEAVMPRGALRSS